MEAVSPSFALYRLLRMIPWSRFRQVVIQFIAFGSDFQYFILISTISLWELLDRGISVFDVGRRRKGGSLKRLFSILSIGSFEMK